MVVNKHFHIKKMKDDENRTVPQSRSTTYESNRTLKMTKETITTH